MPLKTLMPRLLGVAVASVAAMISAAAQGSHWMSGVAAALFAVALATGAVNINRPLWHVGDETRERQSDEQTGAMSANTCLVALLYAWGAAAMLGVYALSGLYWRHGWQYATAMALIAAALFAAARSSRLASAGEPSKHHLDLVLIFTILHGVAAALALLWLVASGKVWSMRSDWAANHVFVAGGCSVVVLSALAAYTRWRLARQ